jgi:hypothetical protein
MRTRVILASSAACAALAAAVLSMTPAFGTAASPRADLLRAPIAGSLVEDEPLFDVNPGGLPWQVDRGAVRVHDNGRIAVDVRGLVIPGLGTATVRTLTATLACDGKLQPSTKAVPLSKAGNARIRDRIMVPDRCIAPVVFLNPNGATTTFIGISGREQ